MRSASPLGRTLVVLGAAVGALLIAWPTARRAAARFGPREDARLEAVSADGLRMVLIEFPSLRAFEVGTDGERPLPSGVAVSARLGPGATYLADLDFLGRPRGSFVGFTPRCGLENSADAPWSAPVWREDGQAVLRRTPAGLVLDGPEGCRELGARWTSGAFVGDALALTDGTSVWLDDTQVWRGTDVRLMMAAGAAWLHARGTFAEVTAAGVQPREVDLGGSVVWEMPHGVCLVDDGASFVVLLNPPQWGSRCWRPGSGAAVELPRGVVPLDVDLAFDPASATLHDASTGTDRPLPATFPVRGSTRALPDGTLRTFHPRGYWQLALDDTVSEVRWGDERESPTCADCGEPTWRSPAEIGP